MTLLVAGAAQARATAAYAAAHSGEHVLLSSSGPATPRRALLDDRTVDISVTPFDARDADAIDAVVVVAESAALRTTLEALRIVLPDTPLLLAPGGFAGALRARSWATHWTGGALRVAEATGFPVAGRQAGDEIIFSSVKQNLPMAAASTSETNALHRIFSRYLPGLVPSAIQTTSLSNTNHLIHPPLTLLNAVRIDAGQPFTLYRDGIAPVADRLISAIDEERCRVAEAVGGDSRTGVEWMLGFYSASGMHGASMVECLGSYAHFATVPGPSTLRYRYLTDDVPHGVAQWAALGRVVGVRTPAIHDLTSLLSAIAPDLDLEGDEEALRLFLDHLADDPASAVGPAELTPAR